MTVLRHDTTRPDHRRLAAAARSILSCPATVHLVVDGVPHVLEGADGETTGMRDSSGEPLFSSAPGAPLAVAGAEGRHALLTLGSGLGRPGSPERDASLTLAGPLVVRRREECDCCGEPRDVVALEAEAVALARSDQRAPVRVSVEHFRSPEHHLNRGYLQRSVEHANAHHQDELRRAVSTASGRPLGDVAGVALVDLRPDRVEVQWVGPEGADRRVLGFPRAARTTAELGDLLRRQLHHGMC